MAVTLLPLSAGGRLTPMLPVQQPAALVWHMGDLEGPFVAHVLPDLCMLWDIVALQEASRSPLRICLTQSMWTEPQAVSGPGLCPEGPERSARHMSQHAALAQ